MIKKLKSNSLRTLAIILSLLMVIYLVPTTVFASIVEDLPEELEETGEITQTPTKNTAETIINNTSPYFAEEEFVREIECELTDKRQANIKHYLMNDGTYMMKVFANAVHYLDANGNWQEIGSGTLTATTLTANQESNIKITPSSSTMTLSGLNTLPNGAYILEAKLETVLQRASADTQLKLRATGAINESTATTTQITSALESSALVYEKITQNGISEFDITKVARDAYAQGNTCTIAFEELDNSISTLSSASANTRLVVNYSTPIGLESYWSTVSQSAGFAGTGHVNVQTGGLTFVIDTLTTTDFLMPTGFPLVYNSTYAGQGVTSSTSAMASSVPLAGNGFKLGMLETIVPLGNTGYYVYTDSDGTQHFFEYLSENIYIDESGLNYTLVVDRNNYRYQIIDANGTSYGYNVTTDGTYRGVLSDITDTSGNSLLIELGVDQRPEQIKLKPNGMTAFVQMKLSYNSAGLISRVHLPHTNEAYIFLYSPTYNGTSLSQNNNGYLRKMIYAKGTSSTTDSEWGNLSDTTTGGTITKLAQAEYTYNSSGYLVKAFDYLQGIGIQYTYDAYYTNEVFRVEEIGHNNSIGNSLEISDNRVRTAGTDDILGNNDDIYTYYTADYYGRSVSSYSASVSSSQMYGGSFVDYVDSVGKSKNKIRTAIDTTGMHANHMYNGGFEYIDDYGDPIDWDYSGDVSVSGQFTFGSYKARLANVSQINQNITLDPGEHTLSFVVDSYNCEDAVLWVRATRVSDDTYIKENIPLNTLSESSGAYTHVFRFNSTGGTYRITIGFSGTGASGESVFIDDVNLVEGSSAGEFSYIQNGHFEDNPIFYWNGDVSGYPVATENYDSYFGDSLGMGRASHSCVSQNVYSNYGHISSYDEGRNYTEFGLYTLYAYAAYFSGTDGIWSFYMQVAVKYYTGNGNYSTKTYSYSYDINSYNWQYGAVSFPINPEYGHLVSIDVSLYFHIINPENAPMGYFDEVVLVKDDIGTAVYQYNTNGFISYAKQGTNETYVYYDDNNNPIITIAQGEQIICNEYDSANRVISTSTYKYNGTFFPSVVIDGTYYQNLMVGNPFKLKTYSTYSYNAFGFNTSQTTYAVDESVDAIYFEGFNINRRHLGELYVEDSEYDTSTIINTKNYISSSATYHCFYPSKIFGALVSETDSLGNTTYYVYDENNGRLIAQIEPNLKGVAYEYDNLGNITYVYESFGYWRESVYGVQEMYYGIVTVLSQYIYNSYNQLLEIITASSEYTFSYDEFNNQTYVDVNSQALATYEYNQNNGKLDEMTYGNGYSVKYVYDALDRVEEILYNVNGTDVSAYKYVYDTMGNVVRIYDNISNHLTQFKYDTRGNLVSSTMSQNGYVISAVHAEYDSDSRLTSYRFSYDNLTSSTAAHSYVAQSYSYNDEGVLWYASIYHDSYSASVMPAYDSFGRTTDENTNVWLGGEYALSLQTQYWYKSEGRSQSGLIERYYSGITFDIGSTGNTYEYTYNDIGYITNVTEQLNPQDRTHYTYDDWGQLIREDNFDLGETYYFTYDSAGNIMSKTTYPYSTDLSPGTPISTITYSYPTYSYGLPCSDRLSSFGGETITYDQIGNPLTYRGATLTWQNGRELATFTKNGTTHTYTYDANGIRIRKSDGTNTTEYIVDGARVMRQIWNVGTNNYVADYIYDHNGIPMAFALSTNGGAYTYYFYETNLHGDITAVYDSNGTQVVRFDYDAWGNFQQTGNISEALSKAILFRYRSYIYDSEIGLYYLQTRYYDPQTGRFINADDIGYLGANGAPVGYNLYAYCSNNPVMFSDPSGHGIITAMVIGAIIFASIGAGKTLYEDYQDDGEINLSVGVETYVVTTLTWAAIGAAAGAVVYFGGLGSGISSLVSDVGSDAIYTILCGESQFGTLEDYALSFVFGGLKINNLAKAFIQPLSTATVNCVSNRTPFDPIEVIYETGASLLTHNIEYKNIKINKFDFNWSQSLSNGFFVAWKDRYRNGK